jgi:hypothetical protein
MYFLPKIHRVFPHANQIKLIRKLHIFFSSKKIMEAQKHTSGCGSGSPTLDSMSISRVVRYLLYLNYVFVAEEITSEQAETNNDDQLTEEGEEEEEGELERREVEQQQQQQEEGGVSQVEKFLCTGAFLYVPYSSLVISNKFCNWGEQCGYVS